MTFKVSRETERVVVHKRVPIRGVRTMFAYAFGNEGLSASEIEVKIVACKKKISRDIRGRMGKNGNH